MGEFVGWMTEPWFWAGRAVVVPRVGDEEELVGKGRMEEGEEQMIWNGGGMKKGWVSEKVDGWGVIIWKVFALVGAGWYWGLCILGCLGCELRSKCR